MIKKKILYITQNSYYFVFKNFLDIFLKSNVEVIFVREIEKNILKKYLKIYSYFSLLNFLRIIINETYFYFLLRKRVSKISCFYTNDKNLNKFLFNKLKKGNYSFVLSIGCPCLIESNFQNEFKLPIYNLHGGILPFQSGVYSPLRSLKKNHKFLGATLHFINNKFDSGEIVSQNFFRINNKYYLSNYNRVLLKAADLLNDFLNGRVKKLPKKVNDYFINKF